MNHRDVYDAFAPLVTDFASAQSLKVAYQGLNFDPPSEGLWLELRDFRNGGMDYGMSDFGPATVMGFFRVLVNSRPGFGINSGTDIAELLVSEIPKGTEIGPARIERTPEIGGPIEDDSVIMQPVTFRYRGTRVQPNSRVFVLIGEGPGSYLEAT